MPNKCLLPFENYTWFRFEFADAKLQLNVDVGLRKKIEVVSFQLKQGLKNGKKIIRKIKFPTENFPTTPVSFFCLTFW